MAKIKEQINYGDRPERMDPRLERKLASPESLYAQNPAMKKGAQDVQRLVSSRFGKVADKLKQVTGIEDISSQQVQGMIYQEMMRKLPAIMRIEAAHREELEELAKEASLEETQVPEDWFEIEARLNRQGIDTSDFRYQEEKPEKKEKPEMPEIPSFDVEDLTDEEILELEKHKRNIINAIVQGAAKKGHYIFQKPEVKARLDEINPSLYRDYLGIMSINDFMYFSMEQMIEMMSQSGQGVAGKVKLEDNDDEEGNDGEEGEESSNTRIIADGMIFPILCHEIIKGIEEAKGRYGLPQDPEMAQRVMGQTDLLSNEPMQLRIGPEIVEKIRFALPDEMYSESNKGLINWFHTVLYQIPAEEFLELIGLAISEDESKNRKATSKFKEIMREAQQLKTEYDDYKQSNDDEEMSNFLGSLGPGDSDDDDEDDGLDDFFSGLGISRPK
jgi:hypothetical protein